jgi:hypothetical protein
MESKSVPRMYGVDCPKGGGHVIRIGKVVLPSNATEEDLKMQIAAQQQVEVADLGKFIQYERCLVHGEEMPIVLSNVRFVSDDEDPSNQPDFVDL